ncbi:MAG: Lrp/AsnC family transcriptional regulator [Candidatus Bathyarchaeia archaeon]|nr:Lrp/AsnC family transcriptional regulator [Candidatus Bathyarchaeota archaeon]
MPLDELDFNILRLLNEDARISYRDMAKRLGVAVGTIHNRVKRLTGDGVIKGFIPLLDPGKLGYDITALMLVKARGGHLLEVEKQLAESGDTAIVYDITGEHDIAVVARFKSRGELNSFVKRVLAMEHVERTETSLVLNIVKEDLKVIL